MSSMLELHLPQAVVQSKHVSYYVAIGAVLFVAWLLQPKKQRLSGIPFYSASKTRWIFDSEKLILDSYGKVGLPCDSLSRPSPRFHVDGRIADTF